MAPTTKTFFILISSPFICTVIIVFYYLTEADKSQTQQKLAYSQEKNFNAK